MEYAKTFPGINKQLPQTGIFKLVQSYSIALRLSVA
jgi:hypothetical protein